MQRTLRNDWLITGAVFSLVALATAIFEIWKPARSAAPVASLVQSATCKAKSPARFLNVRLRELYQFHARTETISVRPMAPVCVSQGQKILLVFEASKGPPLYRGSGTVVAFDKDDIFVRLDDRWLGRPRLLAPLCPPQTCDEIVDRIPKSVNGRKSRVIFLGERAPDIDGMKDAIVIASELRRDGKVLAKLIKELPDVEKGRFVVLAERPVTGSGVLEVARLLKSEGAANVAWLYEGTRGLMSLPIEPTLPEGIKEISATEASRVAKSGDASAFMVKQDGTRVWGMVPGAKEILVRDRNWRPNEKEALSVERRREVLSDIGVDFSAFPKDRKKPIIVYGRNGLDWRPAFIAAELKAKGYKDVSVIKFGEMEYLEARVLKLAL